MKDMSWKQTLFSNSTIYPHSIPRGKYTIRLGSLFFYGLLCLACGGKPAVLPPPVSGNNLAANMTLLFINKPTVQILQERCRKLAVAMPNTLNQLFLQELSRNGFRVVTNPTAKHHLLVDMTTTLAKCGTDYIIKGTSTFTARRLNEIVVQLDVGRGVKFKNGDNYALFNARKAVQEFIASPKLAQFLAMNPEPTYLASGGAATPSRSPDTPVPTATMTGTKRFRPARPSSSTSIVAVFDVEDAAGRFPRKTLDQLTDYLAAKITEVVGYRVVPREQLRARMIEEKKGGYKQCFDESCQIELGKAMSAQKSMATKLLKVGSTCAITTTLFDLKAEITEKAASVRTDCSENGLMEGMDKIVQQLAAR